MAEYRSVYVTIDSGPYGEWIAAFWRGEIPPDDPLRALLEPRDLRGEATAWGPVPHFTVTEAVIMDDPIVFGALVKEIIAQFSAPVIIPRRLRKLGHAVLAVECESATLSSLHAELIERTRPLISRARLTDEEFQRAEWWIVQIGKDVEFNHAMLNAARDLYMHLGMPPLPSARHFRLGYFVRMMRDLERAQDPEVRVKAQSALNHYLSCGEPRNYGGKYMPHTTIASGLESTDRIEDFTSLLWPHVERKLGSYQPSHLTIMGEDPNHPVRVRFFDGLTETFVPEVRPGFKVIGRAYFA